MTTTRRLSSSKEIDLRVPLSIILVHISAYAASLAQLAYYPLLLIFLLHYYPGIGLSVMTLKALFWAFSVMFRWEGLRR